MNKLWILLIPIVVGTGCGTDKSTEVVQNESAGKQVQSQEVKPRPETKQALIESKVSGETSKKRSVSINKEKFTTSDTRLVTGSTVYNVLMREYGTLKSSVVVVGDISPDVLKEQHNLNTVNKIAENTYRVSPHSDTSIYQLYKNLESSKVFSTVELEIDYSGSKQTTADY